jgi:hypothetical protein
VMTDRSRGMPATDPGVHGGNHTRVPHDGQVARNLQRCDEL